MKIAILAALVASLASASAFGEDAIYKCVGKDGSVSYVNNRRFESGKCAKTNLTTIDKITVVNFGRMISREKAKASASGKSNQTIESANGSRRSILEKEYQDEQQQAAVVRGMMKNVGKSDPSQLSKLDSMLKSHLDNIAALKKQLGEK